MEMTINGNGNLPQELVLDILLRLPVKSLSRFKCVSKNWCSLIGNPSFVKLHFESNQERLLIRLGKKHDQERDEYVMDVDGLVANAVPYNILLPDQEEYFFDYGLYLAEMLHSEGYKYALYVDETFSEFEDPAHLQIPDGASDVFGPLNGVFCVASHFPWGPMALLNPALRQFKKLPYVEGIATENISSCNKELGFGLDPLTGDYNLVLILYSFDVNMDDQDRLDSHCLVYVCTSDSDFWRVVEDLDLIHLCRSARRSLCNTYLNGAYYWLLNSNDTSEVAILAFDMGTDKFRVIQVTGCECDAQSKQGYLALCGDSLSLVMHGQFEHVGSFIDVWIMKNEGCWIKSSRVGPLEGISRPLCFWKNNQLLLETMTYFLAQCNVSTQELKTFEAKRTDRGHFSNWVFVYKESLVSIKGEAGKCKLWDTSSDFVKNFFKFLGARFILMPRSAQNVLLLLLLWLLKS